MELKTSQTLGMKTERMQVYVVRMPVMMRHETMYPRPSDEEEGIVDSNMPSNSRDGARTRMQACGRL